MSERPNMGQVLEGLIGDPGAAPETWADFPWPVWVPAEDRKLVEDFWSESYRRGPRDWLRDHIIQGMPDTGERITTDDIFSKARDEEGRQPTIIGRYIHRWNNMGTLLLDDGQRKTISASYKKGARYAATPSEGAADE